MITSFEIYLVMQLDSIVTTVSFAAILFGLVSAICFFFGFAEENEKLIVSGKRTAAFFVAALVVGALTPNTKTAAAMIVVPAIVNNETLQSEAGELYTIAKQALKEALTPEKESE